MATQSQATSREFMAFKRKKAASTIKEINHAIERDPKNYNAYYLRACQYVRQNKPRAALEDLNRAIGLWSRVPMLYSARGKILLDLGYPVMAIHDFDSAIELKQDDKYSLLYRAQAHFQAKHYSQALNDINELIQLDPSNNIAYFERGKIRQTIEKDSEWFADFETAIIPGRKNTLTAEQIAYANAAIRLAKKA
jgi:Tfp pilus assembly protein PilF